jgi:hypothetical protein
MGMLKPDRRGLEDLQVRAEVAEREDGLLELHLTWRWEGRTPLPSLQPRHDELLSVSFDTRRLLFEEEQASYGVGASGELMGLLEETAGFNGARRLYVAPVGEDGEARVLLRPIGEAEAGDPFIRIHAVAASRRGGAAIREMLVMPPAFRGEGTRDPGSELF